MPDLPPPEQLQFRRAQHEFDPNARVCILCKQPVAGEFYQANGNTLCATCAPLLESRQQAPPTSSMLRAVLYGGGAAIAGSIIYATVAIVLHLEIGLIALLIGYMVGKSIRYASHGLGGRPQQILAVVLTYFAITISYIPVFIYQAVQERKAPAAQSAHRNEQAPAEAPMSRGQAILFVFALAAAAPFLELFQGANTGSALISLFIIFIRAAAGVGAYETA